MTCFSMLGCWKSCILKNKPASSVLRLNGSAWRINGALNPGNAQREPVVAPVRLNADTRVNPVPVTTLLRLQPPIITCNVSDRTPGADGANCTPNAGESAPAAISNGRAGRPTARKSVAASIEILVTVRVTLEVLTITNPLSVSVWPTGTPGHTGN